MFNAIPASLHTPSPNSQPSSSSSKPSSRALRQKAERRALKAKAEEEQLQKIIAIRQQMAVDERVALWRDIIIPQWSSTNYNPSHSKVKDLCRKGVPSNMREKVWPLLIGNELQVSVCIMTYQCSNWFIM